MTNERGTLITVDMALEQGREVYVVPGRVTDRLSDGCNRLLKQGAGVFLTPEDFLADLSKSLCRQMELPLQSASNAPEGAESAGTCGGVKARLGGMLGHTPVTPGEVLSGFPDLTFAQINVALMELCMEGKARQISPGHFVKV